MKQYLTDDIITIEADEGYTFIRIEDGFEMGSLIYLGLDDSIDNYEEKSLCEEEEILLESDGEILEDFME